MARRGSSRSNSAPGAPEPCNAKRGATVKETSSQTTFEDARSETSPSFVKDFHGVRYQVSDVSRAVAFYTKHLGFKLERQQLPVFARVTLGHLALFLSGPGASGSRPMGGGHHQE